MRRLNQERNNRLRQDEPHRHMVGTGGGDGDRAGEQGDV